MRGAAAKTELVVRLGHLNDIPACAALQTEVWSHGARASGAQLRRRLELHPRGFFVALAGDRVCGSLTTIRLATYPFDAPRDWYATTGSGWGDTHQPDGPILFGIDLSVSKRAPRDALRQLAEAAIAYAVQENLCSIVAGLRMPRFRRWATVISAEEYVSRRGTSGRSLDPLLARMLRFPGVEVVKVVPRYFADPDSHDFGAVLRWKNPNHEAAADLAARA